MEAGVRPKDQTAAGGRLSFAVFCAACVMLTHLKVEDRIGEAK